MKAKNEEQYKKSDNLKGILNAFNSQVQEIENAMFGLFGKLDINDVSSDQLDRIGDIVGQDRLGTSDDIFRLLILYIRKYISEKNIRPFADRIYFNKPTDININ